MNKRGFMYFELIFVTLLLTSLILLTPLIQKKVQEERINFFLEMLKHDLNYGIEYSITHFTFVKIILYPSNNYYKITDGSSRHVKSTSYDPLLKIDSYITYNTIEITHGNVIGSYYFYVASGNSRYKITIYERSGIIHVAQ